LGAAIFFDSVLVREKSHFRVRLKVDSLTTRDTDCDYRASGGDFSFDPSGDFEFYFIPGSLGDFRWNEIRDVMEKNYDFIRRQLDLYEPTRVNFYISPCRLADVGWDERWQNALDISRNSLYVHFNHGVNELQVETVFMLKLLRLWGYAPGVVLEGAASLIEPCDFFAGDYRRQGRLPEISRLGITADYRKLDRELAAYSAGSFVGFLIKTRGTSRFESFYRRVTDLTLGEVFRDIYSEPLSVVEREWQQYLDTVTFNALYFANYHHRAGTLMRQDRALLYLDRELALSGDTINLAPKLANLYYFFGEYEKAEEVFRAVVRDPESEPIARSYLANLLLIQGKVDEAEKYYREALRTDTTRNYQPELKLGIIAQHRGSHREAISLFETSKQKAPSIPIRVDLNMAIGDSYYQLGQRDSARVFYQAALDTAKILLGGANDRPLYRLRVGRAAVRLGEGANALEHLQTVFFIEERMYYIGQVLLSMGQAYDLLGERELAKEQYKKLFLYPTAWLDREMAEEYMRRPFIR
jgi:tetratricopeptide (TPR) repeat protein